MDEVQSSSPTDTGDIIERMNQLRDEKRQLNAEIKALDDEYQELEAALLAAMDGQNTQIAATKRVHASISEQVVPTVEDWDALYEYIKETDQLHLLQRRVATSAWRELLESGEQIPGTAPYKKRSVNLRKR